MRAIPNRRNRPLTITERVARAICQGTGVDPDAIWQIGSCRIEGSIRKLQWERFVPAARAAIEAMREPTADMLQAGADAHGGTDIRSAEAYAIGIHDVADCWEAMIDAALLKSEAVDVADP